MSRSSLGDVTVPLKALATGVAPADLADGLPIVAAVARWAAA